MQRPSKSVLVKLANNAGVKNLSNDNCDVIRDKMNQKLTHLIEGLINITKMKNTITVTPSDLIHVFKINNENVIF